MPATAAGSDAVTGRASLGDPQDRPADPAGKRDHRLGLGWRAVSFVGSDMPGAQATGEIVTFMAGQSAAHSGSRPLGLVPIPNAARRPVPAPMRAGVVGR
jgi:hypothetical protein